MLEYFALLPLVKCQVLLIVSRPTCVPFMLSSPLVLLDDTMAIQQPAFVFTNFMAYLSSSVASLL